MFSIEDVLAETNIAEAMAHLMQKKESICADGMRIADLEEYWKLNGEEICAQIRERKYVPDICKNYDIVSRNGKKRTISSLGAVDRLISRMLAQILQEKIEPTLTECAFAYRQNKGVLDAVEKVKTIYEQGFTCVASIDIRTFFDIISHDLLLHKLQRLIHDQAVMTFLERYINCRIQTEDEIEEKTKGIIQGNPISPVLSNIYMMDFDLWMNVHSLIWIRYADNIYLFSNNHKELARQYSSVCSKLREDPWKLIVNYDKSGIFDDFAKLTILGYNFTRRSGYIDVRKNSNKRRKIYYNWHPCRVQKIKNEYHIVSEGVLNRQDYSLLFENTDGKHHLPVEATRQLNVYNNITLSSGVLQTIHDHHIRLVLVDRFGNLTGHFVADEYGHSGVTTLKQCELYLDSNRRMELARKLEIAEVHNMRANLRYYRKKNAEMESPIAFLNDVIKAMSESGTVEQLMLLEARAKQKYYSAFNIILKEKAFTFNQRTRRPPKDPINALMSFGNVILYNLLLEFIWQSSLDPRIGIVHSTTNRSASLNLDFADVYKPILVDRLIFSLVNCHQIHRDDFVNRDGGVYLSDHGKRTVIEAWEEKLETKLKRGDKETSYRNLIRSEINGFEKALLYGKKFSPYKYY